MNKWRYKLIVLLLRWATVLATKGWQQPQNVLHDAAGDAGFPWPCDFGPDRRFLGMDGITAVDWDQALQPEPPGNWDEHSPAAMSPVSQGNDYW